MDKNLRLTDSLKKRKLRVTEARKAVFQILSNSKKSMSVQGVFEKIQSTLGVKTDRVSVYRNLSLFTEIGLVHRFQDGRYSICTHSHNDDHGHKHMHIMAACNDCGNTYEVDSHDKELCQAVNQITELMDSLKSYSGITLQGTCRSCH